QRRCPDVLVEEAAGLALAHTERVGETLDRCVRAIERAFGDASHGAADGVRGAAPCGRLRRNLRTTTEAGAEAALLGGGGCRKEAAVLEHGGTRGADGAAVDAGRGDR